MALCLVAATVFWFFNALNKEHTATISFPVDFQYNQSAFIPVKALPQQVMLNITGSGWDLLRKSLGIKVVPLQIELERPTETLKIPPNTVLTLAAAQLGQTKINRVASDTLLLSIDHRKSKKLKLAINKNQLRFELGFGLASPVVILPDSVIMEGPAITLNNMPDSILLAFPPGRISNNVKEEIEITPWKEEGVTISPNSVTIMFEVSELMDIEKKIKVAVLPSPPYRYQVSDDSISVTLRIPAKRRNDLSKTVSLFGVIDLRDIEPGTSKLAPIIKGNLPLIQVIAIDTVTIRKY